MEATSFKEETRVLGPPPGVSEKEVHSLPVAMVDYGDTPAVVSCWKLTKADLERIKKTGQIYLVICGRTMPPSIVMAENPIEEFDDVTLAEPSLGS